MIKVYLTDDQTLFLESLHLFLQKENDVEVVGSLLTGKETITALKTLYPDVLLLDLKLPDISGLDVATAVKEQNPEMKIIILTSFENENDILSVVSTGIDGYIVKDITPEHLIQVIKTVTAGFSVMHSGSYNIMKKVIRKELGHQLEMSGFFDFSSLSIQEWKIIKFVSEGKSNKEIANLTKYTEGTVKNYLSRIMEKTGCRDRTHLAVQALKMDLV